MADTTAAVVEMIRRFHIPRTNDQFPVHDLDCSGQLHSEALHES